MLKRSSEFEKNSSSDNYSTNTVKPPGLPNARGTNSREWGRVFMMHRFQRPDPRDPVESGTPGTVKQHSHAEEVRVMFKRVGKRVEELSKRERERGRARRGLVPTPDAVIFAELLSPLLGAPLSLFHSC